MEGMSERDVVMNFAQAELIGSPGSPGNPGSHGSLTTTEKYHIIREKLRSKYVAKLFGVGESTIYYWDNVREVPKSRKDAIERIYNALMALESDIANATGRLQTPRDLP